MKANSPKNVPRETYTIEKLLDLFRKDEQLHKSLLLLEHRTHLSFNTINHSFVLIWLRLVREIGYFPLVLFESEREAESFFADALSFFSAEKLAWLPLFSGGPGIGEYSALENHISRFLEDHYKNMLDIAISSEKVFEQRVPDKQSLRKHMLHFKTGDSIPFSSLADRLTEMGYQRSNTAEYCGEFAVRGGIIDIYAYGETYPFRIEFFGDTVESVRLFNPEDQHTFTIRDHVQVRPASFSSYSFSNISSILSDKTIVVRIEDHKNTNNSDVDTKLPFKQVFFKNADPGADIRFIISEVEAPGKDNVNLFYEQILREYEHIVVFSEHDIIRESFKNKLGAKAQYIPNNIRYGFQYKDMDLIIISGQQTYRREHYVNPNMSFIPERSDKLETIDALEYGDAVVHVDYGIGIYRGIELLEFRGIKQESMVIEYRNKDRVFVPIRYMNKIFKYSAEKPTKFNLDQIGTNRWEQAKTSTRSYLKKAAFDLLTLYQDRKKLPGFAFHKDTPDTLQLEASFPFDETPDQKKAILEINRDMENAQIMDRLICGDVGFGKTEVAIRAAFKAVYSGKQVAVLVPTTMLCFQHYESFHERLASFGIQVSFVNRFVSNKELRERLVKLKDGQIDILVGTHKLLSKDLLFMDLGLLIIDEEHRFGVNHKEKIQNFKRHVDVMTLTATPIPRTLQLSLVGLRDITKIDTPPKERLPIATKIMYWNEIDIKASIKRELDRNGQVFILHNVIEEQEALKESIEKMFPDSGVQTAHGKMHGPELEKTLLDFYHHRFDILISTTIIESGIDIPNANTLIVMNAHNFGLSQLYQIRGRVGRSYKKAFAYLVIPRGKHINPTAMKRLQTLEYYTDLGFGYQIAMRDLEIRGAGSLFGVEQSGHINRLGYAYFNRLFSEEVEKLKEGNDETKDVMNESPDIHLDQASYLPDSYIDNKDIRIGFYRQLSDILSSKKLFPESQKELEHLSWSCVDRFGPLPNEANNLFNEARLALWLKTYHIESLNKKDSHLILNFRKNIELPVLQNAAGKLLQKMNENHIHIEFISQHHLSAKISLDFLASFFNGNF